MSQAINTPAAGTQAPDPRATDTYWIGQKNINGQLCLVDWRIIEVLDEVSRLLALAGQPVVDLNAKLTVADQASARVALENPPGCNPARPPASGR